MPQSIKKNVQTPSKPNLLEEQKHTDAKIQNKSDRRNTHMGLSKFIKSH